MSENFSNQTLRKLHESCKENSTKNKCIVKNVFFNVFRESSAIEYVLTNAA